MKDFFSRLFGLNSNDNKGTSTLLGKDVKVENKPKEKHFAHNCKDEYKDTIKAMKENISKRLKK